MIDKIDLSREVYVFCQDLNNLGGSEYWRLTESGLNRELLRSVDLRLPFIQERIDSLQSSGKLWLIGWGGTQARVDELGDCVLSIAPLTLDVFGRVSPVLILFNVLAEERKQGVAIFSMIESLIGRELSSKTIANGRYLKRILGLPKIFVFLHMKFFSRKVPNV